MSTANTDNDRPVPTDEASRFLDGIGFPIAPATLATKRTRGGGPVYLKAGSRVMYRPSSLRAWADNHTRVLENTAQAAEVAASPSPEKRNGEALPAPRRPDDLRPNLPAKEMSNYATNYARRA